MSKSNTFENDLLKLIFHGTAIANVADNASSSPITSIYVGLHTADPGEDGDQSTNECTYGAYARVAVTRSSSGWSVSGNLVSPVEQIDFPTATSGTETATYASIGSSFTGTGKIFYYGALSPSISITSGITPYISPTSFVSEN